MGPHSISFFFLGSVYKPKSLVESPKLYKTRHASPDLEQLGAGCGIPGEVFGQVGTTANHRFLEVASLALNSNRNRIAICNKKSPRDH